MRGEGNGRRWALIVLSASAIAAGRSARAQQPAAQVSVTLVCPADRAGELATRVEEVLDEDREETAPRTPVTRADDFFVEDLFRLDRPDSRHAAVWIVLDADAAHIRVAGSGRNRFVFRDLAISQPPSDVDRERIAQSTKVALSTVVENDPSVLDLSRARAVMGAAPVPAPAPATPQPRVTHRPGDADADHTEPFPLSLHLAGFLEIAHLQTRNGYGPGIEGNLELNLGFVRPSVWGLLMAFMPHDIDNTSVAAAYGASFRLGAGGSVAALPWLSLQIGAGADWPQVRYTGGGIRTVRAYRIAVRLGPTSIGGISTSLTLLIERASQSISSDGFGDFNIVDVATTRPGFAIDLWWN